MIVVDASALAKALVEKSGSGDAVRSRLRGETLAAPCHIDAEVLSVLRGLNLSGKLPADRSQAALALLATMPMQRMSLPALLAPAWRLKDNHSAYDALYLALAEKLACPLLTSDTRMANGPSAQCAIEVVA